MRISSSLPSPLSTGRLPPPTRQASNSTPPQDAPAAAATGSGSSPPEPTTGRVRFVLPGNATTRSGQMALREYQTIQNEGGPELVSRIDVRA